MDGAGHPGLESGAGRPPAGAACCVPSDFEFRFLRWAGSPVSCPRILSTGNTSRRLSAFNVVARGVVKVPEILQGSGRKEKRSVLIFFYKGIIYQITVGHRGLRKNKLMSGTQGSETRNISYKESRNYNHLYWFVCSKGILLPLIFLLSFLFYFIYF